MRKKAIDEADIPGKAKTLGIPSKAGLVSNQKKTIQNFF